MRLSPIVVVVLSASLFSPHISRAQPAAEKPKELELLNRYVGNWSAAVTRKSADSESEHLKYRSSIVSEMALDGWFLQSIKNSSPAEAPELTVKALSLTTFDDEAKQFITWDFLSTGRITKGSGSWDSELQVLSWDSRRERPIDAKTRFPDRDTIRDEFSGKNKEGTLLVEKVVRTRKTGTLPDFTAKLWSKIEPPVQPIPAEMKKMQPLVGEWEAKYTQNPSEAFPEGSTSEATITGKWILDGRFFLGRSTRPKYETTWVIGYDTEKQTYRYVRFDNQGTIEENVGNWTGDTRTFEWNVVNGKPGIKKNAIVRLIGNNSIQSHIVAENKDGKILIDMTIRSTRKK